MRYWDSSAIVPLLIDEPRSQAMVELASQDRELVVWWGTKVECLSAIRRRERDRSLSTGDVDLAIGNLLEIGESWIEVQPTESVRIQAGRALGIHGLRTADAFQLAAALAWRPTPSGETDFISLDLHLARAAKKEGFSLPH